MKLHRWISRRLAMPLYFWIVVWVVIFGGIFIFAGYGSIYDSARQTGARHEITLIGYGLLILGVLAGGLGIIRHQVRQCFIEPLTSFINEILGKLPPNARKEALSGLEREIGGPGKSFMALLTTCSQITTNLSQRNRYLEEELTRKERNIEAICQSHRQLLRELAHEIRTPLNTILGFSEILLRKSDPDHKHYLEMIHSGGQRLCQLIDDISTLSTLESDGIQLARDAIDVRTTIWQAQSRFQDVAEKMGIELRRHINEDVPQYIIGDKVYIHQLVSCLISSAMAAVTEGYVEITVGGHPSDRPDRWNLLIEVEDTGTEIDAITKAKLFEPFQQMKRWNSESGFRCTGLELAIVWALVRIMQGQINVSCRDGGEGLRCSVVLPRVAIRQPSSDHSKPEPVKSVADVTGSQLRGTVLVVDDVAYNRVLIKACLTNMEVNVMEAGHVDEALDVLQKDIPDLVITDIRMPGRSGHDLLTIIKQTPQWTHIPVIAFTASDVKSNEENVSVKFDGILKKPMDRNQLIQGLAFWLSSSQKPESEQKISQGISEMSDPNFFKDLQMPPELAAELAPALDEILGAYFIDDIGGFADVIQRKSEKYQVAQLEKFGAYLKDVSEKNLIDRIDPLLEVLQNAICAALSDGLADASAMTVPDTEVIHLLHRYAMLGMMEQVAHKADEVMETDKKFVPFAEKVKQMALAYEDENLMIFLRQLLPKDRTMAELEQCGNGISA